jgi:hypothetical protein
MSKRVGGDRAQSAHNVNKKKTKVERELGTLIDAEDRLQFRHDLAWLSAEVKANPNKMKALKAVAQVDVKPAAERARFLHPDLASKTQMRLPLTFVKYDLCTRLDGFTKAVVDALSKRDPQVMRKLMNRMSLTSDQEPIGTLCKDTWLAKREARIKGLNLQSGVTWNTSYEIDWQECGHFQLLPKMPTGTDPASWVYDQIIFLGKTVDITGDTKVRGSYIIDQNWDHCCARILDPMQPWINIPMWSFFTKQGVENKIKDLTDKLPSLALEDNTLKLVAVEDGETQSASSGRTLKLVAADDNSTKEPYTPDKIEIDPFDLCSLDSLPSTIRKSPPQ